MKKLYFILLCFLGLSLNSCKKENKSNNLINQDHINAIPKKVSIYNDLSGLPDSLYASFVFYKHADSIFLDSFNRDGVFYLLDTSLSKRLGNNATFYYGNLNGSSDAFYLIDSIVKAYLWLPLSCDGVLPLGEYDFSYNTDHSIQSYSRWTISARCDDHIEEAHYEYKQDTLIVNNGRDIYNNYDTIVYLNSETHFSNLPFLTFLYERRVAGFNGTLYYKYLPGLVPFSSRNQKLIHKIICGDFESDYIYTFNTNNDVTQLDVLSKEQNGDPGLPQLLQYHTKYTFEY